MLRPMKHLVSLEMISLSLLFVVMLCGCSGTGVNGNTNRARLSGDATLSVTATAGVSSRTLPSNIPLPTRSVLVSEYGGTLNTHSATVWNYTVLGKDDTPASVIAFYNSTMPSNGWTAIALPTETAQGKYGGTALAYQQNGATATIAAGIDQNYPHAVFLIITVSP